MNFETPTVTLLSLALDATAQRQQAIASNIANANTPGYRPLTVSFGTQLDMARRQLAAGGSVTAAALVDVRPTIVPLGGQAGANSVALDMEVAQLSDTVLRHQILLKALNRHFSIMSTAISEGKR